jgi:hypothetical protein
MIIQSIHKQKRKRNLTTMITFFLDYGHFITQIRNIPGLYIVRMHTAVQRSTMSYKRKYKNT